MASGTVNDSWTMRPAASAANREPSVAEIISRARSRQQPTTLALTARWSWLAGGLSGLGLWCSFTPLEWSPLALVSLVPVLLLVLAPRRPAGGFAVLYLCSAATQLAQLQWMRLGDPLMYPAWIALSLYVAAYLPLFWSATRFAVHRLKCPLVIAAPVLWVGLEFIRAHLLTGFAWYQLGHTQYRWLELIQLSDLVGAYGVSALVMLANVGLTLAIPVRWLAERGYWPDWGQPATDSAAAGEPQGTMVQRLASISITVALFAAAIGYGMVRMNGPEFSAGPRVALIQGNFTATWQSRPEDAIPIYETHVRLTGLAVREQPDVIVWPEGMLRWPLLAADADLSHTDLERIAPQIPSKVWRDSFLTEELRNESQKAGAAMIFGLETYVPHRQRGLLQFNSAAFVRPDVGLAGRYDKLHRVPFGEYVPLKDQLPFLTRLFPFGPGGGLTAGESPVVFDFRDWRIAPVICFEDTVAHVVRRTVAAASQAESGRQLDLLVNLTNDGWFHGSSELDQHLITAAFRAVECRVPLVRAVNTGVSAIIDGNGCIREPERFIDGDNQGRTSMVDPQTGSRHKQLNAALVGNVPLDPRTSLYVQFGDWFGMLCCASVSLVGLLAAVRRYSPSLTRAIGIA